MVGFFVYDFVSRGMKEDSAMLSEDIQEAYTEWVQTEPDIRDDTKINEMIDLALKDFPRQFAAQRAFFTRGLMNLEKEKWEEAATAFLVVSDTWPDSYLASVSLYNAGAAREELGDSEGAAALWTRIVEDYGDLSPDAPEALFNLGRLAETSDNREKAIEYYRDIAARYPESRWTDLGKSRILVLEGRS
jgi:TolA-binding protein